MEFKLEDIVKKFNLTLNPKETSKAKAILKYINAEIKTLKDTHDKNLKGVYDKMEHYKESMDYWMLAASQANALVDVANKRVRKLEEQIAAMKSKEGWLTSIINNLKSFIRKTQSKPYYERREEK